MDRALDKASIGPQWLSDPRIAQCVVDALHYGESRLDLYELIAFVVMSNHVHILIQPKSSLARIIKAIKGFTARDANRFLDRVGQPFWQDESFDRWVRNQDELHRTIRYIEKNPVSAGLAQSVEEYPWSSAHSR
jgi:REP element-mobilizing transposase RayT